MLEFDQNDNNYDRKLLVEAVAQLSALHQKVDTIKDEVNLLKSKQEEMEDRHVLIDKNLVLVTSITQNLEEKIKNIEPIQKAFNQAQGIGWFVTKILFYVGATIAALVGVKELYEFLSKK